MSERIAVVLDLDEGQFRAGISSAVGQLKTLNRRLEDMSRTFGRAERGMTRFSGRMRDFTVIVGQAHNVVRNIWAVTGRWISTIIRGNAELERLTALMRGLRNETSATERQLAALNDLEFNLQFARSAPFALTELTNSFVKLKASGIDPANGSMQSLVDAVAAFGGTDQVLHRATIAIQQMAGKGVISMEELRQQLGEAIPNAMQLMARATNMSVGEMVKQISQGTVESRDALNRLFLEFKLEFEGSARNLMDTWIGLMARMRTAGLEFAKEIGDSGFMAQMKEQVQGLMTFMNSADGRGFARDLGANLAKLIAILGRAVKWIITYREALLEAGKSALIFWAAMQGAAVISGVTTALVALKNGILAVRAAMIATTTVTGVLALTAGGLVTAVAALAAGLVILKLHLDGVERASEAARLRLLGLADLKPGEMISQSELRASRNAFAELFDLYEKLQKQANGKDVFESNAELFAAVRKFGIDPKGMFVSEMVDAVQQKMNELNDAINNQVKLIENEKLSAALKAYANRVADAETDVSKRFAEAFRLLTTSTFTEAATDEQRIELRKALLNQRFTALIELQKQKIIEINSSLKKGASEELEQRKQIHIARMAELTRELSDMLALSEKETTLLEKPSNNKKSVSAGERLFAKLKQDIAGLRVEVFRGAEELSKMDQELAEFNELVRQSADDSKIVQLADQIRELIKQKFALKEITKEQRKEMEAETAAQEKLAQIQAKISADLESKRNAASGDVFSEVSGGMVALERSIAGIVATLPQGNAELSRMADIFDRLRKQQREIDLITFQKAMTERVATAKQAVQTESQARQSAFDEEVRRIWEEVTQFKAGTQERQEAEAAFYAWRKQAQDAFEAQTPVNRLLNQWKDITTNIQDLWANTMNDFTDRFMQFIETGKFGWKDFVKSFLVGLAKIATQRAFQSIFGALLGSFGGGGAGGGFTGDISGGGSFAGFAANGGILGKGGFRDLKKYAKGGVATSPQLAIYGEGSVPEAFVPLPDGRTIPVTVSGSGGNQEAPKVTVNVINRSGTPVDAKQQGGPRFDGRGFVLDVVLDAASRPGRFRDSLKGAVQS